MPSLHDPSESPAAAIGERLYRAGRLVRYRLAAELSAAGHDYPIDFWPTIKLLARAEGVHQEQIAEFLVRDKATATRLLTRMDEAGLVERRRDPDNRRRKCVYLTDLGRATHGQLQECARRVQRAALRDVDRAQLAVCNAALERIFDNLEQAPPVNCAP